MLQILCNITEWSLIFHREESALHRPSFALVASRATATAVLTIRGTKNIEDVLTDVQTQQAPFPPQRNKATSQGVDQPTWAKCGSARHTLARAGNCGLGVCRRWSEQRGKDPDVEAQSATWLLGRRVLWPLLVIVAPGIHIVSVMQLTRPAGLSVRFPSPSWRCYVRVRTNRTGEHTVPSYGYGSRMENHWQFSGDALSPQARSWYNARVENNGDVGRAT